MRRLIFALLSLVPGVAWANTSGNVYGSPSSQWIGFDGSCGNIGCTTITSGSFSVYYGNLGTIQSVVFYYDYSGSYCVLESGPDGGGYQVSSGTDLKAIGMAGDTSASVSLYPHVSVGYSCGMTVTNPYVVVTYIPPNSQPVTVSSSGLAGGAANFNIGTEHTILATVRDANGYANINYFHVLLSYGVDGVNSCYFVIYPNSNTVALMNDAGGAWGTATAFGTVATLSNGSCRLNVQTSSRSISGTDASVTLKVTFLPLVFNRGGARTPALTKSYLYAVDAASANSGWSAAYQTATARTGPKMIIRSNH